MCDKGCPSPAQAVTEEEIRELVSVHDSKTHHNLVKKFNADAVEHAKTCNGNFHLELLSSEYGEDFNLLKFIKDAGFVIERYPAHSCWLITLRQQD